MHFVKSVWLLSGQDGRPWLFMYCTRCNKVFVFVFDQDVGDVTKDRSDGRPVWLEMPRQQRHRRISITPRKNTELLLILLVVTRHNYWIVTLFSMHSNISFSVQSAATFETLNVMFCRWGFPRCQLSLRPIQLAAASGPHPKSFAINRKWTAIVVVSLRMIITWHQHMFFTMTMYLGSCSLH